MTSQQFRRLPERMQPLREILNSPIFREAASLVLLEAIPEKASGTDPFCVAQSHAELAGMNRFLLKLEELTEPAPETKTPAPRALHR